MAIILISQGAGVHRKTAALRPSATRCMYANPQIGDANRAKLASSPRRLPDCLDREHAEVAHRNASAVARERLGSDDDARHEHHDDDVEGAAGECIPGSTSLVDGEACTVRVLFSP
jgi:hypothetical protein